jgi:hypothetical protein
MPSPHIVSSIQYETGITRAVDIAEPDFSNLGIISTREKDVWRWE